MRVHLSLAEHFLNWYAHNTKLYIRGQQGKDWATQRALDKELFDALCVFFEKYCPVDTLRAENERLRAELEEARE